MRRIALLLIALCIFAFSAQASQQAGIDASYVYPHYQVRTEAKFEQLYLPEEIGESYIVRFECFDNSLDAYFEILMAAEDSFDINEVIGWNPESQWLSEQAGLLRGVNILADQSAEQVGEVYLSLYCPEEQYFIDDDEVVQLSELQVLVIAVPDIPLRLQVQVPEKAPSLVTWSASEGWNIYGYLGGLTVFAADASYIFVGLPSPQAWADDDHETIDSWFRSYDVITFANSEGEPSYILIQWEGY